MWLIWAVRRVVVSGCGETRQCPGERRKSGGTVLEVLSARGRAGFRPKFISQISGDDADEGQGMVGRIRACRDVGYGGNQFNHKLTTYASLPCERPRLFRVRRSGTWGDPCGQGFGWGAEELQKLLKQRFKKVMNIKPPSSRADSSEKFVVATGYRVHQ